MKLLANLLILLFSVITNASGDLIFMRESKIEGKQIWLQQKGALRALTSGSNWHLYPDISADGKYVTWVEGTAQDLNVVLFNLKNNYKEIWKFRNYKGLVLQPKFSKNNQWIVVSAQNIQSTEAGASKNDIIYFSPQFERINPLTEKNMEANGSVSYVVNVQKIDESESAYFPRPSSDFGFLIYHRVAASAKKREVIIFDRIENSKKVIDEGMSPSLSVDERYVLYTKKTNTNWDIFSFDRFTNKITQVTDHPNNEMAPVKLADGSLIFSSDRSGNYNLYQQTELETTQITAGIFDDYAPQISGEMNFKQSLLADYPGEPRSSFGAVYHHKNLYMVGGHQGKEHTYPESSFTDKMYKFDGKNWQELASRPNKAHGFEIVSYKNYIYAFGGFTFSAEHKPKWKSLTQIDRYDIKANKWKTIGHMPRARSSNVAVLVKEKVYLIGGWDSTPKFENDRSGKFHKEVDIFDLKSELISQASYEMPSPYRRAFTGVSFKDKIILVGGLGEGTSHFDLINKVTLLDPITGLFSELPEMPFATFAPAAEVLNNELFVFGGMFKTSDVSYDYVSHIYALNLEKLNWRHTGRYLSETKGFSQTFQMNQNTIGILGGHHYRPGIDIPVKTFELFKN